MPEEKFVIADLDELCNYLDSLCYSCADSIEYHTRGIPDLPEKENPFESTIQSGVAYYLYFEHLANMVKMIRDHLHAGYCIYANAAKCIVYDDGED